MTKKKTTKSPSKARKTKVTNKSLSKSKLEKKENLLKNKDLLTKEIIRLSSRGLYDYQIAQSLGIDPRNFNKQIKSDQSLKLSIDKGRSKALFEVMNVIYEKAVNDKDIKAAFWFAEKVGGFSNVNPIVNMNFGYDTINDDDEIKYNIDNVDDYQEITQIYSQVMENKK